MKLLLLADQQVGLAITRWLLSEFAEDLALIVATSDNDVLAAARAAQIPCAVFTSNEQLAKLTEETSIKFDLGVLAWWPKLVKQPLLDKPELGFINTHPSLLPHNRGKHYNFWALVEQAPFGVCLHMVDTGIDSGDVIAQEPIPYNWEDNGETLYAKAQKAMVQLFQDTYPVIRKRVFSRQKQDLAQGSFHQASELDAASRIELDRSYRARDLLNLLRARTFTGHPACWFRDGNEMYEVRVAIKRKTF